MRWQCSVHHGLHATRTMVCMRRVAWFACDAWHGQEFTQSLLRLRARSDLGSCGELLCSRFGRLRSRVHAFHVSMTAHASAVLRSVHAHQPCTIAGASAVHDRMRLMFATFCAPQRLRSPVHAGQPFMVPCASAVLGSLRHSAALRFASAVYARDGQCNSRGEGANSPR